MAQSTRVCSDCGAEALDGDHFRSRIDHSWSDDDPLARLVAHVEASDDMSVVDSEDNDNWQWIEVDCSGRDPVGDSESLSNWVSNEGFSFLGLGDGENVVRFNRQK